MGATRRTTAQEPDLSLTLVRLRFMNSVSAALQPCLSAPSRSLGNSACEAIKLWRLSRRNSAQPYPPWPSNIAKNWILKAGCLALFGWMPGFFKSSTIEMRSSL